MIAIFKREIRSFLNSPVGYLVIGLFLILNGLFLWVFKGPFNIFEYGFADMGLFFLLAPWVFLFLIPAITMRSFSEEKKSGTMELLFIKPIPLWKMVVAKFLGTFALALIAILPTLLYVYTISQLGVVVGNLDMGVVIGSYFGLLFLIASYISIGLFASTLSENQIIAFLLGMVLCFLLFYGFESLAGLSPTGPGIEFLQNLGMKAHFESIARGVLDSRDIIYFIGLCLFFLFLAADRLKNQRQ